MIGWRVREHRARVRLAVSVLRIKHERRDVEDAKLVQSLFVTVTNRDATHASGVRDDLFQIGRHDNACTFAIDLGDARIQRRRSKAVSARGHGLNLGQPGRSHEHIAIDPNIQRFITRDRLRGLRIINPNHLRRLAVAAQLLHFGIEESAEATGILQLREYDWFHRLALIIHACAHRNLFTKLIAKVFNRCNRLVHSRTTALTTVRKPIVQRRILLNPFFDNLV